MKHLLLSTFLALVIPSFVSFAQDKADAAEVGPKVIAEAFGKLSGALAEVIAKGGAAKALSVCSEMAPQIAKEVSVAHGVTLRRATAKARNPKNTADDVEKGVLAAFVGAMAKKETPKPQTIANADGSVSYFAPIVLGNPLCLQCHGIPGEDIAPDTLEAIQKLYPEDKATGFELGDLRGLWHIKFPESK